MRKKPPARQTDADDEELDYESEDYLLDVDAIPAFNIALVSPLPASSGSFPSPVPKAGGRFKAISDTCDLR
jgi:hypothetical protein